MLKHLLTSSKQMVRKPPQIQPTDLQCPRGSRLDIVDDNLGRHIYDDINDEDLFSLTRWFCQDMH